MHILTHRCPLRRALCRMHSLRGNKWGRFDAKRAEESLRSSVADNPRLTLSL